MTGGAEVLADEAVGAVAADDVARADRAAVAVGVGAARARPPSPPASSPTTSQPRQHVDGSERARLRVEQALELGLREHVRLGPAGEAAATGWRSSSSISPACVAPLVDVGRLGERGELVADPGGLQDAGDLVVEVHRARQRVRRRLLLEDADPPAALAEQDRERLADRTVADDGDVVRRLHVAHRSAAAWAPAISSARSSGARNDGGGGGPQLYRLFVPSHTPGFQS